MLSIYDLGPFLPCPAPFNLAAHVLRYAVKKANKSALEVLGPNGATTWTYAQLEAAVRGTGRGLLDRGLAPGDIILMRLGNTVDFPIAYLGAIAVGLIPVPTSSQLTEGETDKILKDLQVAAVLRDPGVSCAAHPNEIPLNDLIEMRDLQPCSYEMGDPNRMAYAVYTSGTSGHPRAVAHAHRAIWARQMMIRDWYDLTAQDRLLHAGAFNWTFTLGTGLMDPWTVGATALIPEPGTDVDELPLLLKRHKASIFAAAPGVYRKLLKKEIALDLPSLRHGLCAGEKLSAHLHSLWQAATGRDLYEAFGMSECSTFISSSPQYPARGEALGRPQTGRRVAILGPEGPVPRGTEGVIAIADTDPGLMLGYLNAPEETAARLKDGWFLTGDQGRMEADGQISYLGRDDDMMNAGGFRVSPIEVETKLSAHPAIRQVGVAAVEVKPGSHIIVAFYCGDTDVTETDLEAFASEHLARYKQPRAYVHLDTLPTGANGKLLRRALPAYFKG